MMNIFDGLLSASPGNGFFRNLEAGRFLRGHTEASYASTPRHKLYGAYFAWCLLNQIDPLQPVAFDLAVNDLGYPMGERGGEAVFIGIALVKLPSPADARHAA